MRCPTSGWPGISLHGEVSYHRVVDRPEAGEGLLGESKPQFLHVQPLVNRELFSSLQYIEVKGLDGAIDPEDSLCKNPFSTFWGAHFSSLFAFDREFRPRSLLAINPLIYFIYRV